jgi:aromatic amino acid transport protein AroP
MNTDQQEGALKRGLSNRHIQLIALGGAIGPGLFLGIAETIKLAGPAVIIGYAIGGFISFLIVRQLGEMVVEEPVAGSFSHFSNKYWGGYAGFLSGWSYWVFFVLAGMAELTAVGIYIQFWWPDTPTWISALVFFLAINAINLANVKYFGEMEFWFAIIKVLAIIGMIVFGAYLLTSGQGGKQANISNLWEFGGFFPNGGNGLFMSLAMIMFSFGGLELIGVTAAEANDPGKTIPQAANQVIYRILIFYIGALVVLLSLYQWSRLSAAGSPFVLIFSYLGSDLAANALNIVVLTAALSVYNSGVYCNSRMLYGLAQQGNAPKFLMKINARGVPVPAIAMSALFTLLGVVLDYFMPENALTVLMSLVVTTLIINWAMISLSHLKFRAVKNKEDVKTAFPAFWFPFANYLCIAFLGLMLVILWLTPGSRISVIMIPVWLCVMWLGYRYKLATIKA